MLTKGLAAAITLSLILSPLALAGSGSGMKTAAEIADKSLHNTEIKSKSQISNPALHNTEVKTPAQIASPSSHNTGIKTTAQIADPTLHNTEFNHPTLTQTTYIYPETYGAVGNGTTDDSAAIQRALLRAASVAGSIVLFSAKTYACAAQVTANKASVLGVSGAKILFTNPSSGGIVLAGASPSLSTLSLSYSNSASNTGVGVYINGATNFQLYNTTIGACPSNNINCFSSATGTISYCTVTATSSNTSSLLIEDCSNVTVANNQVPNFAVLSKTTGSTNLNINNNQFTQTAIPFQANQYGLKLAGLSNSAFSHNTINCGYIWIGAGDSYYPTNIVRSSGFPSTTTGSDGNISNLTFSNNTINGANTTGLSGYLDNALGLVASNNSTGSSTTGLVLSNNTISNIPGTTSSIYFDESVSNSQITQNTISSITDVVGGAYECTAIYTNSTNNISITGNNISTISGGGIYANPNNSVAGALTISNNTLSNVATHPANTVDLNSTVISADTASSTSALTITGNTYTGPANSATYYVYVNNSIAGLTPTISGNIQTTTVLPNFP